MVLLIQFVSFIYPFTVPHATNNFQLICKGVYKDLVMSLCILNKNLTIRVRKLNSTPSTLSYAKKGTLSKKPVMFTHPIIYVN